MEDQGLGKLITKDGQLDPKAFASTIAEANRLMPGNTEGGLGAMGIRGDDAKGFMRLAEVMKTQGGEINGARSQKVDLDQTFSETMGAADSFKASMNRVKGEFSDFISTMTQSGTDLLQATSKSTVGAGATVAGGGILAAITTSLGLKGLAAAVGLGGGSTAAGGAAATAGGAATTGGGLAILPAAAALAAGGLAAKGAAFVAEGGLESAIRDLISALTGPRLNNVTVPLPAVSPVRVEVSSKSKQFKVTAHPSRGGSQ